MSFLNIVFNIIVETVAHTVAGIAIAVVGHFADCCIKFWRVGRGRRITIGARDLSIAWGDDSRYWRWSWINESDTQMEVAELLKVCWFDVNGKFEISKLSRGITYEVIFVIKLRDSLIGFANRVNLRLTLPNGTTQDRTENLSEMVRGQWIKIAVGNIETSPQMVGEIQFSMKDTNGDWKGGLTIKHVVIMPKSN